MDLISILDQEDILDKTIHIAVAGNKPTRIEIEDAMHHGGMSIPTRDLMFVAIDLNHQGKTCIR